MSMASKFISDARWAASRCWCRFGAARRRVERMANAPILLAVLIVEAALGYPRAWAKRGVHPVIWIGRLIGLGDRQWNRGRARRSRGSAPMALVLGVAMLAGLALGRGLSDGLWGAAAPGFLSTTAHERARGGSGKRVS